MHDREQELVKKFDELVASAVINTYPKGVTAGRVHYPEGTQIAFVGPHKKEFFKTPNDEYWCVAFGRHRRDVRDLIHFIAEPDDRLLSGVQKACDKLEKLLEPQDRPESEEHECEFKVGDTVLSWYDPMLEALNGNTIYFWEVKKVNKASIVLEPLGVECNEHDLAAVENWQVWSVRVKPTSLEDSYDTAMIHPAEEMTTIRYSQKRKEYYHPVYGHVEKYFKDKDYYASRRYG